MVDSHRCQRLGPRWALDAWDRILIHYEGYPDEKALGDEKVFQQVLDNPAAADALQDPALKPLLELAAD